MRSPHPLHPVPLCSADRASFSALLLVEKQPPSLLCSADRAALLLCSASCRAAAALVLSSASCFYLVPLSTTEATRYDVWVGLAWGRRPRPTARTGACSTGFRRPLHCVSLTFHYRSTAFQLPFADARALAPMHGRVHCRVSSPVPTFLLPHHPTPCMYGHYTLHSCPFAAPAAQVVALNASLERRSTPGIPSRRRAYHSAAPPLYI